MTHICAYHTNKVKASESIESTLLIQLNKMRILISLKLRVTYMFLFAFLFSYAQNGRNIRVEDLNDTLLLNKYAELETSFIEINIDSSIYGRYRIEHP